MPFKIHSFSGVRRIICHWKLYFFFKLKSKKFGIKTIVLEQVLNNFCTLLSREEKSLKKKQIWKPISNECPKGLSFNNLIKFIIMVQSIFFNFSIFQSKRINKKKVWNLIFMQLDAAEIAELSSIFKNVKSYIIFVSLGITLLV